MTTNVRLLSVFALSAAGCTGFGLGSDSQSAACPDSPATDVFAETVCICEDFRDIGNLIVGRSVQDDHATLAVMGETLVLNNTQVRGDFVPFGGLVAKANVEVTHSITSGGSIDAIGNVAADLDMAVRGNLTGIGRLKVDGTLSVGGQDSFLGWKEVAATAPFQGVARPQCGCDEADIFDVVAAVDAAANDNDNAAAGLPTSIRNIGVSDVRLGTGVYYFTDVGTIGATRLTIDGVASLYIDGNLDHIGAEWIRLTPGSILDLYVSGAVRTIGHVDLGDKWAPSSFRLYIGGEDDCTVSVGNQLFNGAIYAPRAKIHYVGNTNIRGAITAKELTGTGNLVVGYAAPEDPGTCPPPDAPPSDPPGDDPPPPEDEDPPVIL